jgi:hypothetical protein
MKTMSGDTQGSEPELRTADVERVIATFASLAETLVNEFELADLHGRVVSEAVRLMPVGAASILLNRNGALELAAASDATVRRLAELELADGAGPCVDAAGDPNPGSVTDVAALASTWPAYGSAFLEAGYRAVHARPLREREKPMGSLNLFSGSRSPLSDCDLQMGQALADIAALAVIRHRQADSAALIEQLQTALSSRIVVEQAKGVIGEHAGVDMATAFTALRSYARAHQVKLSAIARAVIDHEIDPRDVLESD